MSGITNHHTHTHTHRVTLYTHITHILFLYSMYTHTDTGNILKIRTMTQSYDFYEFRLYTNNMVMCMLGTIY